MIDPRCEGCPYKLTHLQAKAYLFIVCVLAEMDDETIQSILKLYSTISKGVPKEEALRFYRRCYSTKK